MGKESIASNGTPATYSAGEIRAVAAELLGVPEYVWDGAVEGSAQNKFSAVEAKELVKKFKSRKVVK